MKYPHIAHLAFRNEHLVAHRIRLVKPTMSPKNERIGMRCRLSAFLPGSQFRSGTNMRHEWLPCWRIRAMSIFIRLTRLRLVQADELIFIGRFSPDMCSAK
jgi:hypothetical protein